MRKNLRDIRSQDYLLAVGDPVIIGISTSMVSKATNGKYNMLKWDRQEKRYYPLEIDEQ
jgi:hypothetical protein